MPWQPGQSGNPKGYAGPRTAKHKAVFEEIKKLGYRDSLVTLARIQHESTDESLQVAAASALAPYQFSKLVAIPTPRFIETQIDLPPLDSLEHAVQSIALIQTAVAENRLDIQNAQDLIAMVEAYIRGLNILEISELQERLLHLETAIAANPASAQLVHVRGGLPTMPGHEGMILPHQQINGAPQIESTPNQSEAQDPNRRFYRGKPVDE